MLGSNFNLYCSSVLWYDGRHSGGNLVTNYGPAVGIHMEAKALAESFTHNSEDTFKKYYLQNNGKSHGQRALGYLRKFNVKKMINSKEEIDPFGMQQAILQRKSHFLVQSNTKSIQNKKSEINGNEKEKKHLNVKNVNLNLILSKKKKKNLLHF